MDPQSKAFKVIAERIGCQCEEITGYRWRYHDTMPRKGVEGGLPAIEFRYRCAQDEKNKHKSRSNRVPARKLLWEAYSTTYYAHIQILSPQWLCIRKDRYLKVMTISGWEVAKIPQRALGGQYTMQLKVANEPDHLQSPPRSPIKRRNPKHHLTRRSMATTT